MNLIEIDTVSAVGKLLSPVLKGPVDDLLRSLRGYFCVTFNTKGSRENIAHIGHKIRGKRISTACGQSEREHDVYRTWDLTEPFDGDPKICLKCQKRIRETMLKLCESCRIPWVAEL